MVSIPSYYPCTRVLTQWRNALAEQPTKNFLQTAIKTSLLVLSFLAYLPVFLLDLVLLPIRAVIGFPPEEKKSGEEQVNLKRPFQLKELPYVVAPERPFGIFQSLFAPSYGDCNFLKNAVQSALEHLPKDRREIFEDLIENDGFSGKEEGKREVEIFQWMAGASIAHYLLIDHWEGFQLPPSFLSSFPLDIICAKFRSLENQEKLEIISAIFFFTSFEKISPTIKSIVKQIHQFSIETGKNRSFWAALSQRRNERAKKTSNQYDPLVQYS